jgi:hypothetical protein
VISNLLSGEGMLPVAAATTKPSGFPFSASEVKSHLGEAAGLPGTK